MTHDSIEILVKSWKAHVNRASLRQSGINLGNKFISDHVKEVLDEGQLKNFLVNDGEDQIHIVLDPPFEHAILEVVLSLGALLVLKQYILDEHIQELELLQLAKSLIPEDNTSSSEYTHVFEHIALVVVFIFILY
jgi:hypothetical protein